MEAGVVVVGTGEVVAAAAAINAGPRRRRTTLVHLFVYRRSSCINHFDVISIVVLASEVR